MGKLLAHEMGHSIGLRHDGTENDCESDTKAERIMTPTVASDAKMWSKCSRNYALKFVKEGRDKCLYY